LLVAEDRLARQALRLAVEAVLHVVDAVEPRRVAAAPEADLALWDLGLALEPPAFPDSWPVVALTDQPEVARRAWSAGVRGVLDRDGDPDRLHAAAMAVRAGLRVIDPRLDDEEPRTTPGHEALTPRESEVLALLAEGLSDREIGERLGITAHTAKFHVQALRNKLGAMTRTEAVVLAVRAGLVRL
jgi:DNA-binding NarL/FixJ family response regulator